MNMRSKSNKFKLSRSTRYKASASRVQSSPSNDLRVNPNSKFIFAPNYDDLIPPNKWIHRKLSVNQILTESNHIQTFNQISSNLSIDSKSSQKIKFPSNPKCFLRLDTKLPLVEFGHDQNFKNPNIKFKFVLSRTTYDLIPSKRVRRKLTNEFNHNPQIDI